MTEPENQTARTIRLIKGQALREAVAALEDVDPDDVREWLTARAEDIEANRYQ